MGDVCVSCGKDAQYLCGHGCMTPYCGEHCAQNAYIEHKLECAVLIGGASAEEILRRSNHGTPAQRYQYLYREFQFLQQAMTQHMHLNWLQQRLNKSNYYSTHSSMALCSECHLSTTRYGRRGCKSTSFEFDQLGA